jgi:hypothetical protein
MTAHETHKDAIDLLMEDHRRVEGLFARFEASEDAAEKEQIARRVCEELTIHTALEEEIFYPALKGRVEEALLEEAYVEHDSAKVLIREIEGGFAEEAFWSAKVKVLKEAIEHHVEEEEDEHDGLFVQARKAEVELRAMADQMQARKAELLDRAAGGDLPPPEPRTFAHGEASDAAEPEETLAVEPRGYGAGSESDLNR